MGWQRQGPNVAPGISASRCQDARATADFSSCRRGFLSTISINKKSMELRDIFSLSQELSLPLFLFAFFFPAFLFGFFCCFFSKNIMQSLVLKNPWLGGSHVCFRRKKQTKKSVEILLAQVFLNIQVFLVILCTAERFFGFHMCIYKYNIWKYAYTYVQLVYVYTYFGTVSKPI